jgi:uncharacterized protein YbjQ (UPF0145 family)
MSGVSFQMEWPDGYTSEGVGTQDAGWKIPGLIGRAFCGTLSAALRERRQVMIVTTTPGVEGRAIREYLGVVTGEAVLGANIFRDLFAGVRDIVGGRSGSYEKELRRAREIAFQELEEAAAARGANAVVGVDIDYEVLGEKNGMLMVSVSGTAVRLG